MLLRSSIRVPQRRYGWTKITIINFHIYSGRSNRSHSLHSLFLHVLGRFRSYDGISYGCNWYVTKKNILIISMILANPLDVLDLTKDLTTEFILNAYFSVDSFFFVGGLLLTFLWSVIETEYEGQSSIQVQEFLSQSETNEFPWSMAHVLHS